MPRKRIRLARLTTKQVASLLGVHPLTLYQWLRTGKVKEPPRDPANNYRAWTPQIVEEIREELAR